MGIPKRGFRKDKAIYVKCNYCGKQEMDLFGAWDCIGWSPLLQGGFQVGALPTSSNKKMEKTMKDQIIEFIIIICFLLGSILIVASN